MTGTKRVVLYLAVLGLAACSSVRTPEALSLTAGEQAKVQEAARLLTQNNYAAFKSAFRLYAELSSLPKLGPSLAENYLQACLLLGVREKELGIIDPRPLDAASHLIAFNPKLKGRKPLLEVARLLSHRSKGIMGDVDAQAQWYFDQPDELSKLVRDVADRSRTDRVAAYILAEFMSQFGWFLENHRDSLKVEDPLGFHPSSPLLRFVKATEDSQADPKPLEEILADDPMCLEVHYFLGNVSLVRGNLFEAEGHYALAFEAIPESPQVAISLASVAFAEEDFERSIEFFDKTLELMPGYREAILGKAISLTTLDRNAEAMPLLEKLIGLGNYLIGESHFWLAWNLHGLSRDVEARDNIERAKKLLGEGQVFTLSGLIGLALGEDEWAKLDFLEALKFNASDSEALFGLGGIFARKQVWDKSGEYYEKAGGVSEAQALAINSKIDELKASALPETRKTRLIQRKTAQLEKTLMSRALAYYNTAAGYFNFGDAVRARSCALKAASHPALKDKAGELLKKIKDCSPANPPLSLRSGRACIRQRRPHLFSYFLSPRSSPF